MIQGALATVIEEYPEPITDGDPDAHETPSEQSPDCADEAEPARNRNRLAWPFFS